MISLAVLLCFGLLFVPSWLWLSLMLWPSWFVAVIVVPPRNDAEGGKEGGKVCLSVAKYNIIAFNSSHDRVRPSAVNIIAVRLQQDYL